MDSVEPDTQPTPRPRPAKRAATKRAAPNAADPRVASAPTKAPTKRSANGASRTASRPPEPVAVEVESSVELPSPTLPTIVPAQLPPESRAVPDEPKPEVAFDDHRRAVPIALVDDPHLPPVTAPVDPEPELEPIVTFVDPMTMEPVQAGPRVQGPRRARAPRVRRVTRVVRHVDTWSVFKVALVFNLLLYGVCLTAGVLLWRVATATGTVDNAERFFEQFGWSSFSFHGGEIYHAAWIGGLFVIVGLTGFAVLLATLFNLITDLVGGIRVSVLEEEVVARGWNGLGSVLRRDDLLAGAVPEEPDDGPADLLDRRPGGANEEPW